MASKNGSAKRGPRPSADPLHIAKRKRLIAEEYARDGTHSNIKKTISWGDIGKHGTDSPNKRARISLSESITPGLSDMSTPTPINRPRSALKPSSSQKSILVSPGHRPNTQPGRMSIGKSASISQQSGFTFRAPNPAPTPQKPRAQPEVINLISDETPQSDKNLKPLDSRDGVAGASGPSRLGNKPQQNIEPLPPASPTSEAGTQYQEQDVLDADPPGNHVSSLHPDTGTTASQKRPIDHTGPHTTNNGQSSVPPNSPRRKRRTSEVGIQTISDKEVDWLDDLDLDDSMSAIEVSRVWAERQSGSKPPRGDPHARQPEPDEPLTGNFLDEFEGQSANHGSSLQENSGGDIHREQTADPPEDDGVSDEQVIEGQADGENIPVSSQASPTSTNLVTTGPPGKLIANIARYPHLESSPLRFPSSPPHEGISNDPQSSIRPYPFNLSQRNPPSATDHSQKDTTAAHPGVNFRPFSSSQPNPFVSGPRARSRLYTPQPAPPVRNINLNELRAAPTLGRSPLEDSRPTTEPTKSVDHTGSVAESDTTSNGPDSKAKLLKAAPTLGRSTDWGHVSPSRPVATDSDKKNGSNSGHQPTDYDVEYGSVPEAPSSFPSRPPSSPAHSAWEVEPLHASTPHRLVTQMSTMAQDLARENNSVKATSVIEPPQPSTLVDLEKRRRSSIAPLAESKKIRREYHTAESSAAPNLRAHRDTYDESGRRSWVPKRPNMKRALDPPVSSTKKLVEPRYPAPVAEEPEPTEEVFGRVSSKSAPESRAETFEPVPYGESMQEHQVELEEQPGRTREGETGDRGPHPSTEIAETPQSTRVRNLYDLATSDLQSHRFTSDHPEDEVPHKATDYAYVPPQNQTGAGAMGDDAPLVDPSPRAEPIATPVAQRNPPGSQVKSSQRTRSDGRPTKKGPSKLRRQSLGLHITPARQTVLSTPRTRLSLGGRSGISVLEVSKSDQDILVQAGLRPILKRLSQAHGFTVDVIAGVYQEMGSLKDTEDTLERMKHSAERTRVSISRRRSTLEISHGEGQDLSERDSSEASGANNDYLNWDTSRMSSRILFGEGL